MKGKLGEKKGISYFYTQSSKSRPTSELHEENKLEVASLGSPLSL
jgi:hypothetical protein